MHRMASNSSGNSNFIHLLFHLFILFFISVSEVSYGKQTFSFDIHHRFSDSIRKVFPHDHLPEKGSFSYYKLLAHRDTIFHGYQLAGSSSNSKSQILTFADGNTTYLMTNGGYLHYTTVSLGTPSVSFFVALDTGSDVFWVPCNCLNCTTFWKNDYTGVGMNLKSYIPSESSTSKNVACNSNMCKQQDLCIGNSDQSQCPYQLTYADQSSTSGYLVEDFLHMETDNSQQKVVGAQITFGCSESQTGNFFSGGPFDGLFGLGLDKLSVPSILSNTGLTANSFSMCFGSDGVGRINFGDTGSSDQAETSFFPNFYTQLSPKYTVNATQITVGTDLMHIGFAAIFDTGTSFTYLNDPAYTRLTKSFNAQVLDTPLPPNANYGFEYCYIASGTYSSSTIPTLSLTMLGGSQFPISNPIFGDLKTYYCLAVFKNTGSSDFNIIGQNFMSNYVIVFDRERSILGWKASDCYGYEASSTTKTQPISSPTSTPTEKPSGSATTSGNDLTTPPPPPPDSTVSSTTTSGNDPLFSRAPIASVKLFLCLNSYHCCLIILFLVFFNIK